MSHHQKIPLPSKLNARRSFKDLTVAAERVKSSVDIMDVMESYGIEFSSRTEKTAKACCFNHQEDTPSMMVSADKQLFNCFGAGCTIGGDVINFVMVYNRLNFADAIWEIIERCDIDVSDLTRSISPEEKLRERLLYVNDLAVAHFIGNIHKAPKILSNVLNRGISRDVLDDFKVGFAVGGRMLRHYLRKKGVTNEEITLLQFDREDIYNNRIVYPIIDEYGHVISFYGRATVNSGPKYLGLHRCNPDTGQTHPLLDTSTIYGLNRARKVLSSTNGVLLLVEGFNDVLAAHSAGIHNAAGMQGAILSQKQYEKLDSLHINNLIICPDGDEAGLRTIEQIQKNRPKNHSVKIMFIPDGLDPDEYLKEHGRNEFQALINDAVYPIELIIKNIAGTLDEDSISSKLDVANNIMKLMHNMSTFERELAIDELSTMTNVDRASIEEMILENDQSPLSDIDLEKAIINECMNDHAKCIHAMSSIGEHDFASVKNGMFWSILRSMMKEDIRPFSREMFAIYAVDKGFMQKDDVKLLPSSGLGPVSLDYAVAKFLELATRRRLLIAGNKLSSGVKDKNSEVSNVLNAHMGVISVCSGSKYKTSMADAHIISAMDTIHERMSNPGIPGIHIGQDWKRLMKVLLGFQPGHMTVVAGTMKAGKTALAQNWCMQQFEHDGIPTLWVNMEMSELDLTLRNLSILTGIDNSRMKVGNISDTEKEVLDDTAAKYHGYKLHVASMAGASVFDVVNVMRKHVYTSGIKLIFIDYLQLIQLGKRGSSGGIWEDQQEIVGSIRQATSQLGVSTVVVSQLNRGAMSEKSTASQHIAGTIRLLQDCDSYLGLRPKTKQEMMNTPHSNTSLQVELNRHGPQGIEIDVDFERSFLKMKEI